MTNAQMPDAKIPNAGIAQCQQLEMRLRSCCLSTTLDLYWTTAAAALEVVNGQWNTWAAVAPVFTNLTKYMNSNKAIV